MKTTTPYTTGHFDDEYDKDLWYLNSAQNFNFVVEKMAFNKFNILDIIFSKILDILNIKNSLKLNRKHQVSFIDTFNAFAYVYFVFFTTFGNRIKIKGPISSTTNSFSSMQFRQCSLSIFKQYSDPKLLESCRRGFITLEPFFFKHNNMMEIYKVLDAKYDQFKNMSYIPIPIPPYYIGEIISFITEQFKNPKKNQSNDRKRKRNNNNVYSHPLKKQKQNSISKQVCDKIICGTFRMAFGTSKYKPYVRGKFIYVPNPANDDVYSNSSQSRGVGVLKFVIFAILMVVQYLGGGVLRPVAGIASYTIYHQLNQGYNYFVKFIKRIDKKRDELFGVATIHQNQVGRVNLTVVHIYLSSLFSLVSLGSQVEDFNKIYCRFLYEFQYIPESLTALSVLTNRKTFNYSIGRILLPIKTFIDSVISSNFAKQKTNNKLGLNINYYTSFKRKHLINLYTNYIKLVYVYAYNEATMSSALIEFPIKSYNPYKSMRSSSVDKNTYDKIVYKYVLYKTGQVHRDNGDKYKREFENLVKEIISKRHSWGARKFFKSISVHLLGKVIPVTRIL